MDFLLQFPLRIRLPFELRKLKLKCIHYTLSIMLTMTNRKYTSMIIIPDDLLKYSIDTCL